MTDKQNTWLDSFQREAGIRRCILLHGDTLDLYKSNNNSNKYLPIQNVIISVLMLKGFTDVVLWDKFNGASNITSQRWSELQAEAVTQNTTPQNKNANTYDMGLDDDEPQTPQIGNTPPNIDDFLPVVYHHLTHQTDKRIAFILDWSQYLFGTNSSLSEEDRQRLLMLSKSLNNAPLAFDSVDEICKPSNMLVLLTSKLGNIPPIFYQGNACVKDIVIPSPNRNERETFLRHELNKWNFSTTPQLGTPQFDDFVDATDGLSIRDLLQLAKLSRQLDNNKPLSFEKLINLYRYGEQKSPWEDLSKDKLRSIETKLQERVKGQNDAIRKVTQVIIRAFTGLSGVQHSKKQRMPKGTLFFVGPTGVGKTELAKTLAEFLFGDEETCIRFDMSEFNHEQSDQRLVGAPPGYVGYEEGGQLTNAVKKRPFAVLLFDEIEKAHPRILDKFLQILEDGRLTDGKGDTVQFSETIIIFTSNIGAAEIKMQDNFENVKQEFITKVKEHFTNTMKRPELLNRIGDNIVPFNFITNNDFLFAIAQAKLKPIREKLKEKYGITDLIFRDEQKALSSVFATLDKSMGGRGVLNELVKNIIDPLSEFLFMNDIDTRGKRLIVSQVGNTATFTFNLE
ncbi:MAG: AAA family ATPase [Planctomycetaceae bacterium]|jgi:DNA polymerase III delta prime subunit|nr:AAA family ATPase [Planctomycetaceae bacterium]